MFPFINRFRPGLYDETEDPMAMPYKNISFGNETLNSYAPLKQPQQPPEPNFFNAYQQLQAQKSGPSMSAYRDFINKGYPTEESPGLTTRLGAILSGAAAGFTHPGSGYDVAQNIIHEPYKRELAKYSAEGNRLQQGAQLEESERQHNITAVKSILDAQNKQRDDERLDKNTNSQIELRNAQIKKAEQELTLAGYDKVVDKTTGHTQFVNKLDPTQKIDWGKFDQSINEKALDKIAGEERGYNRSVNLEGVRQTNRVTNQKAGEKFSREQQDRAFTQADKNREDNQQSQKDLQDAREKAIDAREKLRVDRPISFNQINTRNQSVVDSLIKRNPNRYKNVAVLDATNGNVTITNPQSNNTEDMAAFKELFDALYKDIVNPLELPKSIGKYQIGPK